MADQQVGPGLYVKLGLDTQGMIGGVGVVSLALNQTLDVIGKFERGVQQFLDLAINAGRFGKELKDNARDLGLSTQQFQQWRYAAIGAGSSAEEIIAAIRLMSVRMKEATDPTSEMGKTLAALGVSVVDSSGNMRSMNDVLMDVFPALNALPVGFARNQAAMTLFGRGFSNIADLASLSKGELQKLIDQAPIISDEKIAKLDAFNTKMALMNEKLERTKTIIGEELIGSFSTWGTTIDNMLQKGQPLFLFFQDLNILLEAMAEGFVLLGGAAMITAGLIANFTTGNFAVGLLIANKEFEKLGTKVKQMQWDFAHPNYGTPGAPSGPGPAPIDTSAAEAAQKKITDGIKDYTDALKDAATEKKKLFDLDKDYGREMSLTGWDVAAARELTIRHGWAVQDQAKNVKTAETKAGQTLSVAGNLVLNIPGYTGNLKDAVNQATELAMEVRVAGIPS